MRLTIASDLPDVIRAEVRLVHVDEPASSVTYPVWQRVMATPGVQTALELPDAFRLTARAALLNAKPTAPFELLAGRAYRITGDGNKLQLQLEAKWQNGGSRPRISVINDARHEARLEFLGGDGVVWCATVGVIDYGIFDLSYAVELTFVDDSGRALSRSIYVPPDGATEATLLCRRVLSTGRVYVDAVPASARPAASRWSSPSRVTFDISTERPDFVRRLAVFLVPRDSDGIELLPWKTFDLRARHRFQFDPEAHAAAICDLRCALLAGEVHAVVETAAGGLELIVDTDAWLDPPAARIDNYASRPIEALLLSGDAAYAVTTIPAAVDGVPSRPLAGGAGYDIAFLLASESELHHRFSVADVTAAAQVVRMPAPGSEIDVHVGRWRIRVNEHESRKEQ